MKEIFNCETSVVYQSQPQSRNLYTLLAPDFEVQNHGEDYFGRDVVMGAGDRITDDNQTIPYFVCSESSQLVWRNEENHTIIESYKFGDIRQGTWDMGEPESVASVCRPEGLVKKYNSETQINDYFVNGRSTYIFDGSGKYSRTYYFMLNTCYNRPFTEPDSLVIGSYCDTLGYEITMWFPHYQPGIVEDIDQNGDLDWIVPHWSRSPNTSKFIMHIVVYDPEYLTQKKEYTEIVDDIEDQSIFNVLLGCRLVDINNDNRFEILAVFKNRPIRIIDYETMELIAESDFVVPCEPDHYFFASGRFDESGRYQIILYDGEQLVVYNLPEGWSETVSLDDRKNPVFPESLILNPAFPNPFNSSTTVTYSLPRFMQAKLAIYNTNGQLVEVLVDRMMPAGAHSVVWDADGASAGEYLVRFDERVRKVVLVK